MCLNLHRVLEANQITHADWRQAIRQTNGEPLSKAAGSRLLNWGVWPRQTPRTEIHAQTEAFLRERGVAEQEIKSVWDNTPGGDATSRDAQRRLAYQNGAPLEETQRAYEGVLPEIEMLTQKAKQRFGLPRSPFINDVNGPEDVYLSTEQRYIREAMYDASRNGGFLAVVGESGAGKSVLRRDLAERIRAESDDIVLIYPQTVDKSRLTAAHICDAIIADISNERPRLTLEAKSRQVQRLLSDSSRGGRRHALVIEEAHDLAISTLKYLKRFWELEDGFRRLLGVVLIGQPELHAALDERRNWAAREVIRRCEVAELLPFNRDALRGYLALKFQRVGVEVDSVLADDAYDALLERLTRRKRNSKEAGLCLAYPLTVNNAVTRALNLAAELGAEQVDGEIIRGV